MAYDGTMSPFTNLNLLRLYVGDVGSTALFTDNELNGLITKFTVEGTPDLYKAAGWALRALAIDLDRALAVKKDTSMALGDFMDQCWKRSEAFLG